MENISDQHLKNLVEAAIFTADKPLSLKNIKQGILADYQVQQQRLTDTIKELIKDYQQRGIELVEVASGFRFQVVNKYHDDLIVYHHDKAPKFSRALLETLALIAYRQPITRGEIEKIRGVTVSSHLIKALMEREWVKIVGEKQVPGRPKLYATTAEFLDYFTLKSLTQLPEAIPITEEQ
jgi:segregation and condensation protein B